MIVYKKDLHRVSKHVTISSLHNDVQHQSEVSKMNKRDKKQIEGLRIVQARLGMNSEPFQGMAARLISAMIRCAMSRKSREALMAVAADLNITTHPDFIV